MEKLQRSIHTDSNSEYLAIQTILPKFMAFEMKRQDFSSQKQLLMIQNKMILLLEMPHEKPSDNDHTQNAENLQQNIDVPNIENQKAVRFKESLVALENEHQCQHCNKTFVTFKGLQKHVRQKHVDKSPLTCADYKLRSYYICLLNDKSGGQCLSQVEKARITRHLKEQHGIERPNKKEFRGFLSFEDKDGVEVHVCWKNKNEENPPELRYIKDEDSEGELENNAIEVDDKRTKDGNDAVMPVEILEQKNATDETVAYQDNSMQVDMSQDGNMQLEDGSLPQAGVSETCSTNPICPSGVLSNFVKFLFIDIVG